MFEDWDLKDNFAEDWDVGGKEAPNHNQVTCHSVYPLPPLLY
jgi:hypothetical protein